MRLALLAAAAALLPVNAMAQDAPDWSGWYSGVSLGSVSVDSVIGEDEVNPPPTVPDTRSDIGEDGYAVSLFGGYNWQVAGNFVVGVEADATYADVSTSGQLLYDVQAPGALVPGNEFGSELQWMASVRARAGYAFGRWMPYITAGWAFAQYETTSDYVSLAPYSRDDTWSAGVYGVGIEYMAPANWSVRGEYRTADFGDNSDPYPGGAFPDYREYSDLSIDEIRFSFAYNY